METKLTSATGCWCAACGLVVDGAHECSSVSEPAKSRLYDAVFHMKRQIAIRAAVRRRRGR